MRNSAFVEFQKICCISKYSWMHTEVFRFRKEVCCVLHFATIRSGNSSTKKFAFSTKIFRNSASTLILPFIFIVYCLFNSFPDSGVDSISLLGFAELKNTRLVTSLAFILVLRYIPFPFQSGGSGGV